MKTANTTKKTKWLIDPSHSEISFVVKHLMINNIRGTFKDFSATVFTTLADFTRMEIDFRLAPESVSTGVPERDEHLRSHEFFDVKNHRLITFKSNTLKQLPENGRYALVGDLTIKGISRQITLDVAMGGTRMDPWGDDKAGFSLSGLINRKDWGLNWNVLLDEGGSLVSEEVKINCEVELVRERQQDQEQVNLSIMQKNQ